MKKRLKCIIASAIALSFVFSMVGNIKKGTSVDAATTNGGFVTREGTHFMLDGKAFYFAGCNSYDLFTLGDGSNDSTTELILDKFMNQDKIEERFELMAKNGVTVCRTWGFSSETWHGFETAPGKYNEAQFMLFDYIMACASKYNIKIIITLENFWDAYGGIDEKLKWAGKSYGNYKARCEWFTNEDCQKWYKDYIKHFATRKNYFTGITYKDDPTIFAWDLMNEPRYEDYSDEENRSGKTLRKWVDNVGEYLKSIDENHMICAGIEGHETKYGFGGYEGNPFVYLQQSPYIDFCSAHPYPSESWARLTPEDNAKLVKAWIKDAHEVVKKPIVIGEFNAHNNLPYEEYEAFWHSVYDTILEEDAAGALFWEFNTFRLSPFTVMDGDKILDYFMDMSKKMNEKSGLPVQSEPTSTPTTAPTTAPTSKPTSTPTSTPTVKPTSTPTASTTDAKPLVSVTSDTSNSVSQKYTIKSSDTKAGIDLSKVTIKYYFNKSGKNRQTFSCDNAGLSLNKAPYYEDYSKSVKGTLNDNCLEITFKDSYILTDGYLYMGTRFYNTDWSELKDFSELKLEIYYNDELISSQNLD